MIYLDHAATTRTDPRVFELMKPYFCDTYGNPSSTHQAGQKAKHAMDCARSAVAKIVGCVPREIIFTSGGTESNNLFIFGAAEALRKYGKHIVTTNIEHDSVLKPLQKLESDGFEVTYLDVGKNGIVDAKDVKKALRPDTIFITIIYANNEIGTIQPIAEIGKVVSRYRNSRPNPYFHTDACQAAAYLDLSVEALGVDAMTVNSGKIYGPKGAGMLFVKNGTDIALQILGGGQEYRRRAGTENVPSIIGFAEALKLVQQDKRSETKRLLKLRDKLINGIKKNIPDTRLNGDWEKRLPNNINISFRGLESGTILLRLDMLGIAVSAGSACNSVLVEPPHVLSALGISDDWIRGAIRFSLGHGNTEKEIDYVLKELPGIIRDLRTESPFS